MASQGPHLQEVMSPTIGPEAGVMSGAVRAGNPSPRQPAEPVGGENLQTADATSGPSISTAGQSPSPQLPQEVRTGGDGTSGSDGSLGTTGARFTVSTGILADVGGMQGSATGLAQGYGATTAQSGIIVSGATAVPDGSADILVQWPLQQSPATSPLGGSFRTRHLQKQAVQCKKKALICNGWLQWSSGLVVQVATPAARASHSVLFYPARCNSGRGSKTTTGMTETGAGGELVRQRLSLVSLRELSLLRHRRLEGRGW